MSRDQWIENDLVKHGKSGLNTFQVNEDPGALLCYLYMENQKYFITDLATRLHATLSTKVKFKGASRPPNNASRCLPMSVRKYLYSAQLKYVFIFIDEVHVGSEAKNLIDFERIGLVPSGLRQG